MRKQKKRKTVPAALHSEISEYASLLRALRATDTLDITTQLTRLDSPSSPRHAASVNEEETGQREASTLSHVMAVPSALDASILPRMSRNTWTRWPLPAEDLHIPEWGFEDEVHSLAKKALLFDFSTSNRLPADTASASRGVDPNVLSEDQIEALLPPSSLRTLADVSSSHLEHILSALASYSPPVDKSTQHRRHPISWESVLNIVSAAGLVDGNVVRNVKSRLEVIYGSHLDSSDITSSVPEFPAMTTLHDLDRANFFDGGNSEQRRRKRGPYKKSDRKPLRASRRRQGSSAEDDS
ncbi:hypothetical protein F5888DRAFT_1699227 [Russula emetica]|nr:hypothetical protein F5888DRAFT_1699227 [Russula emetica]